MPRSAKYFVLHPPNNPETMSNIDIGDLVYAFNKGYNQALQYGIDQGRYAEQYRALQLKGWIEDKYKEEQPDKDQRIADLTAEIEELIAEWNELKEKLGNATGYTIPPPETPTYIKNGNTYYGIQKLKSQLATAISGEVEKKLHEILTEKH